MYVLASKSLLTKKISKMAQWFLRKAGYREADLSLFSHVQKSRFSHDAALLMSVSMLLLILFKILKSCLKYNKTKILCFHSCDFDRTILFTVSALKVLLRGSRYVGTKSGIRNYVKPGGYSTALKRVRVHSLPISR